MHQWTADKIGEQPRHRTHKGEEGNNACDRKFANVINKLGQLTAVIIHIREVEFQQFVNRCFQLFKRR
ncbi:Uncharacterised protein [Vibrio cholerae]|nr:Uncharacterised protein [Vibrio cholerae]CSB35608.1 Uncharacterised protein [Vibrio cholerae]CSC58165.1 Uncharacterised protein [Vibrio cholerae]CSD25501.1 Uncharacterised protein [Vibrio cholerae]CSI36267.1 Uncharacterised protein [Vibrio cholerae]